MTPLPGKGKPLKSNAELTRMVEQLTEELGRARRDAAQEKICAQQRENALRVGYEAQIAEWKSAARGERGRVHDTEARALKAEKHLRAVIAVCDAADAQEGVYRSIVHTRQVRAAATEEYA